MDTCIYKETLQLCQPLKQVAYEESELSLRASQKFITGDIFITYAGVHMITIIGEHDNNVHGDLS